MDFGSCAVFIVNANCYGAETWCRFRIFGLLNKKKKVKENKQRCDTQKTFLNSYSLNCLIIDLALAPCYPWCSSDAYDFYVRWLVYLLPLVIFLWNKLKSWHFLQPIIGLFNYALNGSRSLRFWLAEWNNKCESTHTVSEMADTELNLTRFEVRVRDFITEDLDAL